MDTPNKSSSTPNINDMANENTLSFVSQRNKRQREEDLPSEFRKFQEEMRQMLMSFSSTQQSQMSEIKEELKGIQQTNSNIDASMLLLSKQNEELQMKVESLEVQNKANHEYISLLEHKVEDLQRSLRKSSIEIKNVPKKSQESKDDLIKMVTTLSSNINLQMKNNDIKDIFRLTGRGEANKNPPIILEFGSTLLKNDFLKKTKQFNIRNKSKLCAKHLGHTTNEDTPVFVSEQLTAKGARLFFLARDLVKSKKYKYCWTSFSRVFVRRDDNSQIIHIINESQVQQLIQKD